MGMYTELFLRLSLNHDSKRHIEMLRYMLDNTLPKPETWDHPLFECDRWEWFLRCSDCGQQPVAGLSNEDDTSSNYLFTVLCAFKDYNNEMEHFFDWLKPLLKRKYSDGVYFVGYHYYEERDEPTLLYNVRGEIKVLDTENLLRGALIEQGLKSQHE